ncbi:MAG: thioesterase family protein [Propionibacteriaceae bacterium]|jgi:acyl-CoA thioester hydrolase|nr:thioesterase family protein [Propionibacteriaceae bacterium]
MRVEVPLRWGDLDAQGHVNNARFIDYLQDARADFLYELGIEDLLKQGFAVQSNQIEYEAPVFFSEVPLIAEIGVACLNHTDVTLAYRLFQNGRLVATARTTLSGWDIPTRTRQALPARARSVLETLIVPVEPLREIAWADMTQKAKVSEVRVRWSDLDIYGHVNNAIIFDYVQEGRITFTVAPLRGTGEADETDDHLWFLARQDVHYQNSVVLRKEPYLVRTGVARIGNSSLTMSSQVDDPITGLTCARAAAVAVFADAAGHPTPLTAGLRASFGAYLLGDD